MRLRFVLFSYLIFDTSMPFGEVQLCKEKLWGRIKLMLTRYQRFWRRDEFLWCSRLRRWPRRLRPLNSIKVSFIAHTPTLFQQKCATSHFSRLPKTPKVTLRCNKNRAKSAANFDSFWAISCFSFPSCYFFLIFYLPQVLDLSNAGQIKAALWEVVRLSGKSGSNITFELGFESNL